MKLRFENTIEDLIAGRRRFCEDGPLVKRPACSMAIWRLLLARCIVFMGKRDADHGEEDKSQP